MLNIELDQTTECCNPACRAEIAPPDEQHRFCPECGAAQVFECEVCTTRPGALLRVAEDPVCPRCGAVYVLCGACRYPMPITSTGALSCPEGCGDGLTEARGGWAGELAGVARTGTVLTHPQAPDGGTQAMQNRIQSGGLTHPQAADAGEPQILVSLGETIARPVCRFGRLYALTARGVVVCLDEESAGEPEQWRHVPVTPAGAAPPADAALQASERFLIVGWGGELVACSIVDGELAFRFATELQELRWAALDDRLLLCGRKGTDTLRVELRDTSALCRGEDGLLQSAELAATGTGRREVNWPAAGEGTFVFCDLDGNVLKISAAGGEEFAPLWANRGYSYISAPAVVQGQALAVVHAQSMGAAWLRVPLQGARAQETRLEGLTPAYLGPRLTRRHLYLFDDDPRSGSDSRSSFHEYDLAAPGLPSRPIFLGVTMTGDQALTDVLVLEDPRGRGCWIVTLNGEQGSLTPRMVHTETQERPTIGGGRTGTLALAASDRRLFICDLQSGEVLAHQIPKV
jgi:hypothetical protein